MYLCSLEVTAAAAFAGEIIDSHNLADESEGLEVPELEIPEVFDNFTADLIPSEEVATPR